MQDIEQLIKKEQWLAGDRFKFNTEQGVEVGLDIFQLYQFNVSRFSLFESLLSKLDNKSLCQAFDYFEANRLRTIFNDHFHKTDTPQNPAHKVAHLYLQTLLRERANKDQSNDIPSVRSEIAMYGRMFPTLDSDLLINALTQANVILPK
ncbi:hypothetical protein [Vibrio barjaei]|uniref:hypothetical protein n=1 Tax=Vibrio barjaei TaxID=1676683 RepID=UPI0022841645|nr:hypothetical protein [Vibrio barjaei]MCY9870437.1 hypothetical protein [Vibrio barjaei]